jgi:hypothetical protein
LTGSTAFKECASQSKRTPFIFHPDSQAIFDTMLLILALAALLPHAAWAGADGAMSNDGLIGKGKLAPLLVGKGKAGLAMGPPMALAAFSAVGKGPSYPPAPADWAAGVCTG